MKPTSNRSTTLTLLCAGVAGAALVTAALAQPPRPGGTPAPGGAPAPGAPAPGAPAPGGGPGGGGPGPGGGGPGPGGGGPGGAPTPSPTFEFRMCNKTKDIPVIFVATVGATGQQFHAQGWTQVPLGQCVVTGRYQRPSVWWHGRDARGTTWGAKFDVDLCVNLNGGFDYTWAGSGRTCAQGETGVPFVKVDVGPQFNAFDMNLN